MFRLSDIEPGDTVELSSGERAIYFSDPGDKYLGFLVGAGKTTILDLIAGRDTAGRHVIGLAPLGHELSLRDARR